MQKPVLYANTVRDVRMMRYFILVFTVYRKEQKFFRLKHIQTKIHIGESMILMECTESEKYFQVEGQKYSSI